MMSLIQNWCAKAPPTQDDIARAELNQLLDAIGIMRFDSRVNAGCIDERLGREVMDEHFRKAEKRGPLVTILKAVLS